MHKARDLSGAFVERPVKDYLASPGETLVQNSLGMFLRDMFTSPISLILIAVIVMMCMVQTPAWRKRREAKKMAREAGGEAASASEKKE